MRALQADARRSFPFAPHVRFACAVTSWAYWGKRQYGDHPDETGRGSLANYLNEASEMGRALWEYLADDGVWWLNLGDTQSKSGGAGGDHNPGGSKGPDTGLGGIAKYRQGDSGLPALNRCLVPSRVAERLQSDGWIVRAEIIWDKFDPKKGIAYLAPEDIRHVRRTLFGHEMIYLLAKCPDHRFFGERLPERGDVWHFPPFRGGRRRGPAVFPDELPRRCILASTEPGDLVLDPCAGTGTTARVADELGRVGVAMDLYRSWFPVAGGSSPTKG